MLLKNTLFIDNHGITDPRINLALEEYALRNLDITNDYLLFYINEQSVIIGRHQNAMEEINYNYLRENNTYLVRRISGGGTVYHDPGNLNFSFITGFARAKFNNYQLFNGPIIEVLKSLGIDAELNGRNDMVVNNRKISGNAQFTTKDRMLSHGTLLFDSNLDRVEMALQSKKGKFESKGIKSVRSSMANISEFLDQKMDMNQFREYLLKHLFADLDEIPMYNFSSSEWKKIHQLAQGKYTQWYWNYGESPKFNVKNSKRFPSGETAIKICIEKGLIQDIKFDGDFSTRTEIGNLEKQLLNLRYDKDELHSLLKDVDLTGYFGAIRLDEFLDLLF